MTSTDHRGLASCLFRYRFEVSLLTGGNGKPGARGARCHYHAGGLLLHARRSKPCRHRLPHRNNVVL